MTRNNTAGKPEVTLLYCRQCVRAGAELSALHIEDSEFLLRSEMLPCSSKVRVSHLMKILNEGSDAVEVVGCPETECRFLVGSRRAQHRVAYARALLEEAGLSPERVGLSRGKELSAQDLLGLARTRWNALKEGMVAS